VIDWSDRVLLQRIAGIRELGLYSVGYSFGMAMALIAEGAFGSAWPPFFMSFMNRREEAVKLFGAIFKYVSVALGLLALMFFVLARPVVQLITAPAYHGVYTVVGMVASAYVLKICYLILLPGMVFARKLHLQAGIEWAAAFLNIALNLILIPRFGIEGAAGATLLAYLSLPVLTYLAGHRYLRVEYDWTSIGRFALGFIVIACISLVVLSDVLWLDTAMKALLFLMFCAISTRFILSANDKRALVRLLSRASLKEA
jgi:O-antigen/teichoic acid export membrane protein